MAIRKTGIFVDNPETFVDTSVYRSGELGVVYEAPNSINQYQLVKLASTSDAAGVAKDVTYWSDPAKWEITMTIGESLSGTANSFAGVVMIATPVSSFSFIKQRGKHNVKAVSGTKGVATAPHTADNQVSDNTAALFVPIVGVCYANAAGGFADTLLQWDPA